MRNYFLNELKTQLNIVIPLIGSGLLETLNNFISMAILGQLNPKYLAAGGLATYCFGTMVVILWWILSSIGGLISEAKGAGNTKEVASIFQAGLILAFMFSVIGLIIIKNITHILLWLGIDSITVALAGSFLSSMQYSILPDFISIIFVQFLISHSHAKIVLYASLLRIPLSVILSYLFAFGSLGFPNLGIMGIGYGASIALWINMLSLLIYVYKKNPYRQYLFQKFQTSWFYHINILLRLGIPSGAMFCIEMLYFFSNAVLMSYISENALVAFQIAMQYCNLLFLLPMCISQAISLRVGYFLGMTNYHAILQSIILGIIMSSISMSLLVYAYWSLPDQLIAVDLQLNSVNNKVRLLTKDFLIFASIFQIVESLRICIFGALRGMRDTKFAMVTSIFAFVGIAFPTGCILLLYNLNPFWIWKSMILGSFIGVVVLSYYLLKKIKGQNMRLIISPVIAN